MGMLASGPESKKVEELDNPLEIIRTLTDLVGISYMVSVSILIILCALEDRQTV